MTKEYKGLLGAHMSIEGGIYKAFIRGHSIGCTTIQIFTHSNRQWKLKDLSEDTIEKAHQALQDTGIKLPLVHASYLINLGSLSAQTQELSRITLQKELIYCQQLLIPYLVLHPGSGIKDSERCIEQIAHHINKVLEHDKSSVMILLETMAGQGSSVCATFEQLALLRSLIHNKERIGICVDTCHLWAAGYDFSTKESYTAMWAHFERVIGLKHLKAFHLNDSQKPFGSRVDRHADIGKGTIPLEAFRLLMNDSRFMYLPKVVETPDETLEQYADNLELLKDLVK